MRLKGCRRDTRDARDFEFKFKAAHVAGLPAVVDLRKWCVPTLTQDLSDCTANALTAVARWHIIKAGGKQDAPLSRLQLYYDERAIENCVTEDAGAEIRDGIKCMRDIGVCYEADWPYNVKKFAIKPPPDRYQRTQLFGSLTYERVDVSINAIKVAIATGFPVVIGISLFASFESDAVEKSGVVPMPDITKEEMTGGHCMYVAGYGQKPGYFTVHNSWGDKWGDKGFCYIPEAYLGSAKFGSDYWVIKNVTRTA